MHCLFIVFTVQPGRVDQPVAVFDIKIILCHNFIPLPAALAMPLLKALFRRSERISLDQLESAFCGVGVSSMRRSGWMPSIVPKGDDKTIYIVVDDFGRRGRAFRETDIETADLENVILGLLGGEFGNPIRVVAFNTFEGWSQDVSADIAQEVRRRCDLQLRDVPSNIQDFVERHDGLDRQLSLRLA
jgi:hypothetical protein